MRYRKRPIEIDAWPVREVFGASVRDPLIQAATDKKIVRPAAYGGIFVDSMEGIMYGSGDDYLIRGIEGEFYVCKRSIFDATYDPVDEPLSRQELAEKYGEDQKPKMSEEDELRARFPRE